MTRTPVYTAYGEHKCDLCPEPIKAGQQYLRETEKIEGKKLSRVRRQHYPLCSEKTRGQ